MVSENSGSDEFHSISDALAIQSQGLSDGRSGSRFRAINKRFSLVIDKAHVPPTAEKVGSARLDVGPTSTTSVAPQEQEIPNKRCRSSRDFCDCGLEVDR
jgi:hypothetical protein